MGAARAGNCGLCVSLDQQGLTRDVADSTNVCFMAGHADLTSADATLPDLQAITGQVKGMKIGIPKEYVMDGMDEAITALWQQGRNGWSRQEQSWCRFLCRIHAMRCQPITLLRRQKPRLTWRVMTGCAMARVSKLASRWMICMKQPGGRFWR